MVADFPVAKLLYLAVRQIGKPVSNFLKERAKTSFFFRKYVCIPPAQFHHFYDTQLKMQLMGLGKPKNVKELNEEQAVETGATILGEGIIYVIGAFTIFAEYMRQSRKETAKEEAAHSQMTGLVDSIKELTLITERHAAQVRELERLLHAKK